MNNNIDTIVELHEEVKDLEKEIATSNKVLDDINVPATDTKGNALTLAERLYIHREQIESHLSELKRVLTRYS